jgi:HD-like signal output (HDOD) protein/CheY-like chemotaxis protein
VNRILFVDDEPRVLAGLRRMLRSRQPAWDMRFVEGAGDALRLMEQEPVDVVVSDFRMPGFDGGQLLAEVRRRYPDTARFVLSGHTAEEDLMRVVTIAHQFLTKPCERDEIVAAIERVLALRHELGTEAWRAEWSCVSALPSVPSAFRDLVEVLHGSDCDARTVADVLQRDMGLTAKVLQLVNSSFFALRARTTSLEAAVALLGIQTVRSLVLMDEVVGAFLLPPEMSGDWLALLNAHALETAFLARRLAEPEARDDAFCGGLLHECGQLVLAICRPQMVAAHLGIREREARSLIAIESETFGVTHAQAGAYLLNLWGFPLEVIEATARHATGVSLDVPGRLGAVDAVRLAHALVEAERISLCGPPGTPGPSDVALRSAGVLDEVQAWRTQQTPKERMP